MAPSSYRNNPCISLTALTHQQWEYVLRPGMDSAIDATCGNGHDSKKLAEILFSDNWGKFKSSSSLICIDIQAGACDATKEAVRKVLDNNDILENNNNVQVLQASHASLLPQIASLSSPLALVCWNLGYLPRSDDKLLRTEVRSTISSIVDAAISIRIGGMLSVMTYPKTNADEDSAVRLLFVELS
eukprot:CAMPEP_0194178746 /NCGR_PEP_ID=MMETSP0154-20130528/12285_1 /TAXON_ID=1049557 /ORGANISM="Thalassiothrix antarctica, Strain L6-D1" /LENGTH=185 /DNA_ID=CAMNT_0038893805 /DNA_START=22 /DNA_END=576 /DNA_ORIENTATION=-